MAEEKQIRVHFICEAEGEGSPPRPLIDVIASRLVEPAIPSNANYRLDRGDFRSEPGTLDHYTVDMMASDDLVIADLTDLANTAYFLLGARTQRGLPIVYICDESYPIRYDLKDQRIVRYDLNDLEGAVDHLREEIELALHQDSSDRIPSRTAIDPLPSREMRLDLVNRLEATVELIKLLRINSITESVDQLTAIVDELNTLPEDSPSKLHEAADKSFNVLSALLSELSSQPGARMAITGAIALIVGGAGASGAVAFSAGLAFWHGKDAFSKFVTAWGNRKNLGDDTHRK